MVCIWSGVLHLRICCWICLVLGSSGMVSSQWDFPTWNPISRSEYQCLRQHDLHLCHCASLHVDALPFEIWAVHILCMLGGDNEHLHSQVLAGDKGYSHWRNDHCVAKSSLLEQVCLHRRRGFWTWRGRYSVGKRSTECLIYYGLLLKPFHFSVLLSSLFFFFLGVNLSYIASNFSAWGLLFYFFWLFWGKQFGTVWVNN